jgi:RNA polymerase sigma-70 factor, ECF subfamily
VEKAELDDLLRRARCREPAALGDLVETYSPRVFGLLYRLTGSQDVAEDLLQETFLRVVRAIEEYEHAGKFEPWLFRIAANLARDHARKRGRRGELGPTDRARTDREPLSTSEPASAADDPARDLIRREDEERLVAGLQQLTDSEREIILLRHFSELSFREIAEVLRVPLGTALARAHRALQHLRGELTDED